MNKSLNIDFDKLAASGFVFKKSNKKFPMSNSIKNINKLLNFPLKFLEDDRASTTVFAEFPDELIVVSKMKINYSVFGSSWNEVFLQSEKNNSVYVFDLDCSDLFFINTSLSKFAQCTCAKTSCIMAIRAYNLSLMDLGGDSYNEDIKRICQFQSRQLKHMIEGFDLAVITESNYWLEVIEQIEDGFFADRPNLDYFLRRGKILL